MWLLFLDDVDGTPVVGRMEPFMLTLHVESPVFLEVITETGSAHLEHGFGHFWSPAHARAFHPVLDEILAGAFDDAGSDRSSFSEIFIVAHMVPIAIEIGGSGFYSFFLLSSQPSFGGALPHSFDHLRDIALQESQGTLFHPRFGFGRAFLVEGISRFPQFRQSVLKIQYQRHVLQAGMDFFLQGTFPIGKGDPLLSARRVPSGHLLCHFVDDAGFAFGQTRPHPFVFRTGSSSLPRRAGLCGKETIDDLLWRTDAGRLAIHGSYHADLLFVPLLSLARLNDSGDRGFLLYRDTLAIHRTDQNRARVRFRWGLSLLIERLEIDRSFLQGKRSVGLNSLSFV